MMDMRDKDLPKELWRKSENFNTLKKVLGAIRANEAAAQNQSAVGDCGLSVPGRRKRQEKRAQAKLPLF